MFDTVDGRNPATVDMVNTHYLRFHTSQVVVWDFFHQQWLDLMQSPLLKRLKLPGSHHSSWLFSTTRQGHFLHAPLHQQNKLAGDVCWYKVVPLLTGLHYCFLFDRYIHLLDANSRCSWHCNRHLVGCFQCIHWRQEHPPAGSSLRTHQFFLMNAVQVMCVYIRCSWVAVEATAVFKGSGASGK